jgi:hypothetical protein
MPGSPTDGDGPGSIAVSAGDYLWFVDLALSTMAGIVEELGDDLANRRPPFRGGNSAYVILTRCLGVMEYWGGAAVAERPVQRDRGAELGASGDVAGLLRRTEHARRRLREDIVGLDATATPVGLRQGPEDAAPYTRTKGAALIHVLQELFELLGHMQLTRDVLVAGARR